MAIGKSKAAEPNWANQTIWTGDNLDIMRRTYGTNILI